MASISRLYADVALGSGRTIDLNRDQAHYLFGVMRRRVGDRVDVFNGRDGAWSTEVSEASKRSGSLRVIEQVQQQRDPPDLWLLFSPIKKARTDFIVEKAAELGAARICPVQTDHTNSERIRQDRLQAHAIEAAEQCGGTFVPPVEALVPLSRVLDTWPVDRQLLFCDEAIAGEVRSIPEIEGPWAVMVGPEGGFSAEERIRLRAMPNAHSVSLGPRILRADTAAVAALTLWQTRLGDWR